MNNLAAWLRQRGYRLTETMIVGDRAMLTDEIAIAYDRHGLRHLTGGKVRNLGLEPCLILF